VGLRIWGSVVLVLAGAMTVGCGAAGEAGGTPFGGDQPQVWLDGGSMGHDAQQVWGLPLDAPYAFATMSASRLLASCPVETTDLGGCTDLHTHLIMVLDSLTETDRQLILLHEVGHALANHGGHLSDGCFDDNHYSKHVMCSYPGLLEVPTSEDFGFVMATPEE
jgi:hypothetical protein